MEKFFNFNKILIQSNGSFDSQKFIITDLEKVSQVTLDILTSKSISKFIIEDLDTYDKNTREFLDDIINTCNIRKILYLNNDIINAIHKFDLYITDREKDKYYTIRETSEDKKKLVFDLYIELENLINNTKLDPDTLAKLNKNYIFPNDNGNHLILGSESNFTSHSIMIKYKSPNELDIKIKNNSWERQEYLKNLQE